MPDYSIKLTIDNIFKSEDKELKSTIALIKSGSK